MRRRGGQPAKARAGWRGLASAWRWLRSRHSPLGLLFLLALLGGAIFLALLPALYQAKTSDQAMATGGGAPRSILAKAAAVRAGAMSVRPRAPPSGASQAPRPVKETALRPPPLPVPTHTPPPRPAPRTEPAWLRFATPAAAGGARPLVAIVLDDLGLDRVRTAAAIRLPAPITLSFMTYAEDLAQQTAAARRAGHELLLHVPMEAVDRREDPGPHALYTALSRGEILDRLRWDLGRFDGYVGINNHMGSKFTADVQGMAPVIAELRAHGLLFLDSRTTAASAGIRLAAADGVPHAGRDVFLDDELAPAAIARQLAELEAVARRRGSAIAIGHAHDATLAALRAWLPTLAENGYALVPLTAVVRYRMAQEREPGG